MVVLRPPASRNKMRNSGHRNCLRRRMVQRQSKPFRVLSDRCWATAYRQAVTMRAQPASLIPFGRPDLRSLSVTVPAACHGGLAAKRIAYST
jgi:hypothetical protein